MRKQITAAMMILTMIAAPAMANSMENQVFENQVFRTQAGTPMQLAELSPQEMKDTEGAVAPWVAGGIVGGIWGGAGYMHGAFIKVITNGTMPNLQVT